MNRFSTLSELKDRAWESYQKYEYDAVDRAVAEVFPKTHAELLLLAGSAVEALLATAPSSGWEATTGAVSAMDVLNWRLEEVLREHITAQTALQHSVCRDE